MSKRCEDEEAHEHPQASSDQCGSSSESFNDVETRECHAKVDSSQDHRSDERVFNTDGLEDGSSIVEVATRESVQDVCQCSVSTY